MGALRYNEIAQATYIRYSLVAARCEDILVEKNELEKRNNL